MKQIKKDLIIVSILLSIIILSYPLLMSVAYSLADQDVRVISTIEGIKPVIDSLYMIALILGCFVICTILWCWYFGEVKKPKVVDRVKE